MKDMSFEEQIKAQNLEAKPVIFSKNRPPIKDPKAVQKETSAQ